ATVPVLCWHQLRDWTSADGEYARTLLICPPQRFRAQLDALGEDGWNTISADHYLDHLTTGATLPPKPILLSFDDSQGSQITEGLPQLRARKMTATFFAMTVVLGKRGWFTQRDLKRLDDAGMTVAAHTWDHHRVDQYRGQDWSRQLRQPRELLEKIIGKPVQHFAYPYGAWNRAALPHVAAAGYQTAFQLADRKPDAKRPLLTLRRDLVTSTWSGHQLLAHLRSLSG
ncbi:MAG: icaB, partial [Friedmanniella sp.]|nr:icaB [Friedmanniella sp.]